MHQRTKQWLFWTFFGITAFAAAMGYLEAVVVVYLRAILTRRLDWHTIEITREAATLVMLVAFAFFAGRNARERTGVFFLIFGVWDIVYYLGLKIWLDWPESLMTMDTLFYIPCTWASPVYVPVMFASLMIIIGGLLICGKWTYYLVPAWRWGMLGCIIGCAVGIILALLQRTPLQKNPVAVSAMVFTFAFGMIAAGAGVVSAFSRRFSKILPVIIFAIVFGAFSGWLGYMAAYMFDPKKLSLLWTCGAAIALNIAVLLYWWALPRTRRSN